MSALMKPRPWPKPTRPRPLLQPLALTLAELALVPIEPATPAANDDEHPGCGWFDSSLDLARGLLVIEHDGDFLPDDIAVEGLQQPLDRA